MHGTILADFAARARTDAGRVALRTLSAGGAPGDRCWTWSEWMAVSRAFAAALVDAGAEPGERVAILAGNRPVWPFADLGTLMAGGVSVGLYPTSAPRQVQAVLRDAQATVLVVDTVEQLEKLAALPEPVPTLRTVILGSGLAAEDGATPIPTGTALGRADDRLRRGGPALAIGATVITWDDWIRRGERALATDTAGELERRLAAASPAGIAALIYTSGSTGEPKGARIPHRYITTSADSIRAVLELTESDTSLSLLPYGHAGERVFGLYTRIRCGMEAALVEDHGRIWEAAQAYGPTIFGGVPRFFEKAYELLAAEHSQASGEDRSRWDRVVALGRERSRLRRAGGTPPAPLEREWRELGSALFERARSLFGRRLRLASSGGAPLPAEAAEYLDALGITVLGAYGLTEHLCVAFNRPADYAFDAAGPPMPGTEIRIAADGEILVRRSDLTFDGYHGRETESGEAFTSDGGWLLTGDLGSVDERGFLRVEGRKKDLIALSTGKKVAPAPIEAMLTRDPWIAEAMLYGEGRKFVSALLALRRPVVEAWAAEAGLELDYAELLEQPALLERVEAAVAAVNARLSSSERVRRFAVLERGLSAEAGELTPTQKVRRPVVAGRYAERLEALYR